MKQSLWNSEELCKAINGKSNSNAFWNAYSISLDSRKVKKGSVFFAIEGINNDGHDYIKKAFQNGAIASVVNATSKCVFNDHNFIEVENTFNALEKLAVNRRKSLDIKLIAITGSVGKTSTKDFLSSILNKKFRCYANEGNYNNKFGVPLSLSQIPKKTDYFIQEMGMSLPKEIKLLSNLAEPNLSIITSISGSHLGNFKNIKDIAYAKSEIFQGMKKNGIAILPGDSIYLDILKSEAKNVGLSNIFLFGYNDENDCQILSSKIRYNINEVTIMLKGQKIKFKINSHQKHDAVNSAAAVLASNLLGLSTIEIQKIIPELSTSKRRGSISYLNHSSGSKVTIVDDSYNASYESTVSAISSLRNLSLSSPVLILGDMLELGQFSSDEHKKLIPIIEEVRPRLFIGVGRQMSIIGESLESNYETLCFKNSYEAKNTVPKLIKNNDLILVKGSNGMHLSKITQAINLHFKTFEKKHLSSSKANSYAI